MLKSNLAKKSHYACGAVRRAMGRRLKMTLAIAPLVLPAALSTPAFADHHERSGKAAERSCAAIVPTWKTPALVDPASASPAEIGCAMTAWQLAAKEDLNYLDYKVLESSYGRGWIKAAFYVGLERFADTIGDDALMTRIRQFSYENGFELGDRIWHGDDQAVAAVYGELALRDGTPDIMKKSMHVFDDIIASNYTNSLEFIEPAEGGGPEGTCQKRWCWADAIFMAPPAWAITTTVSGDRQYLDYAVKETKAVIDYLQDPETGLFFRDSRYFEAKTENGKPVFWSRGNGWVIAGLARFIELLPADHPDRAYFIDTYKKLADQLVTIQREDGYWPTSLMDAALFQTPETSGTGFFGFGLAWGINEGILTDKKYTQARDKAWDAMRAATSQSGMLGWVQQIGKDPQKTSAGSSQLYGVGAMLLFASEMVKAENPR